MEKLTKEDLIDKYILVGFTYLNTKGEVDRRIQLHGIIRDIVENSIFIRQKGGEEFMIPFDIRAIFNAQEGGVYTLKSTGESISDVDYTCSWTIEPPKD